MKNATIRTSILISLCITFASCNHDGVQRSESAWENVLESCGASGLINSKPLYFGAANANGVGSIWSLDETTGDYWPTSQFKDITSRTDIIYTNKKQQCEGDVKSGVEVGVDASIQPVFYPVSGEINAALANVKSAQVKVDSIVLEEAWWDKFNEELRKLPANGAIKSGIEFNNRFIVGRAWKIQGFKAVLIYKGNAAAGAKAIFDAKAAAGTLGVSTKLTSDSTLEISSTEDLYIAGVLRKLSPTGVSAGSQRTVGDWVPAAANAKVNPPK